MNSFTKPPASTRDSSRQNGSISSRTSRQELPSHTECMQASRTGVRAAVMSDIRKQPALRHVNTSELHDRSDPTMYFGATDIDAKTLQINVDIPSRNGSAYNSRPTTPFTSSNTPSPYTIPGGANSALEYPNVSAKRPPIALAPKNSRPNTPAPAIYPRSSSSTGDPMHFVHQSRTATPAPPPPPPPPPPQGSQPFKRSVSMTSLASKLSHLSSSSTNSTLTTLSAIKDKLPKVAKDFFQASTENLNSKTVVTTVHHATSSSVVKEQSESKTPYDTKAPLSSADKFRNSSEWKATKNTHFALNTASNQPTLLVHNTPNSNHQEKENRAQSRASASSSHLKGSIASAFKRPSASGNSMTSTASKEKHEHTAKNRSSDVITWPASRRFRRTTESEVPSGQQVKETVTVTQAVYERTYFT